MTNSKPVYITIDWQEQSNVHEGWQWLWWKKKRQVCSSEDYPQSLPCNNPDCENGGFDIGHKIAALLVSNEDYEQNSLICRNAIHKNRDKRCMHIIAYAITCVRPFQRHFPHPVVTNRNP